MISDRPAEAEDRAVPGHWEGDLIIGKDQQSQIGTLVDRSTRYVLLVHLPCDRTAETVRDALAATMATLPAELKRSLTWDQGSGMGLHHQFSLATDLPVYFCDPHSPWQRGSNENTNGLLEWSLDCYASTSPKGPTCRSTAPSISPRSPPDSTADHAKRSTGKPQPSVSPNSWHQPGNQSVLQQPLDTARPGEGAFRSSGWSRLSPRGPRSCYVLIKNLCARSEHL